MIAGENWGLLNFLDASNLRDGHLVVGLVKPSNSLSVSVFGPKGKLLVKLPTVHCLHDSYLP